MATPKPLPQQPVWQQALMSCADPARASHALEQLASTAAGADLAKATPETAQLLAALFAGSQAMGVLLLAHPEWLAELRPDALLHARRAQGFRKEVAGWLEPALATGDYAGALRRLRQFKQRELLRIAARDLGRLASTEIITRELSDVADICLSTVLAVGRQQMVERHGQPYHQDADGAWQPTEFVVMGLGKLGGQELNYSSDVDVVFLYSEEGHVFKEPPRALASTDRAQTNHQFFKRLSESFVAEVARATEDGTLYRIDLRLRPEGDGGPLVRSLASYENYYAQWGQTWERMMLIKARPVAGDATLAHEFLDMVQPFRFPRSLHERALAEIAAMKERIENEVVRGGELERNVKLGRGGIREIEFVAQILQLLHAGRLPFLQSPQTLAVLEKLVTYNLLTPDDAKGLSAAYYFLRDVEHRLQMENNLQTHTVPTDRAARERLARLMGASALSEFERALDEHRRHVRRVYDRLLKADRADAPPPWPKQFEGADAEWKPFLAAHGFKEVDKALRLLHEFAHGPGYVHVSARTTELAWQLLPKLFELCPKPSPAPDPGPVEPDPRARVLSHPDRVLTRMDSFISAYGARATLFEAWTRQPAFFELLLLLFDRSEFLAERAIRSPELVDDLVQSGRLHRRKTAEQILADLRYGLADADQPLWMRRYHQAEQMRIGLREILGLADWEMNLVELSALADACLQYALEVILRKHQLKKCPLAIVGLGKLGGQELSYGSDLDIVFVSSAPARELPRWQRVAAEVMDLLSAPTEQGLVFPTDARLRPDGEKGLLVNTFDAYEDYYRRRAQLWEIQAISRSRAAAGDAELGRRFVELTARLSDFSTSNVAAGFTSRRDGAAEKRPPGERKPAAASKDAPRSGLAAYRPDWKQTIAHMRQRIEKERTVPGQEALAFKTGAGGLVDAEFIAQALCLAYGWHEPNTLRALERARDAGALARADAEALIASTRQLRRLECILRRWSFEGESVLPTDPAPYYRVSVRCGFPSPEAFRDTLAAWRSVIREVYGKVLNG